jgi:hypothetical protein
VNFGRLVQAIRAVSFDHLIGNLKDAFGNREAERLAGFEFDDQRVFGRVLNREVGRTGAPEDVVDVGCCPSVQVDWVEPVGHQATSGKRARADQRQTLKGCCGDELRREMIVFSG